MKKHYSHSTNGDADIHFPSLSQTTVYTARPCPPAQGWPG